MTRLSLAAGCLLVAGCGGSLSQGYELMGSRGHHTYMVYVPPKYAQEQSVYEHAIRDICTDPQGTYLVMFWNDRGKVWYREQPEMTAEQAAAQVAGYIRNSDVNDFYWLRAGERVDVGPIE